MRLNVSLVVYSKHPLSEVLLPMMLHFSQRDSIQSLLPHYGIAWWQYHNVLSTLVARLLVLYAAL